MVTHRQSQSRIMAMEPCLCCCCCFSLLLVPCCSCICCCCIDEVKFFFGDDDCCPVVAVAVAAALAGDAVAGLWLCVCWDVLGIGNGWFILLLLFYYCWLYLCAPWVCISFPWVRLCVSIGVWVCNFTFSGFIQCLIFFFLRPPKKPRSLSQTACCIRIRVALSFLSLTGQQRASWAELLSETRRWWRIFTSKVCGLQCSQFNLFSDRSVLLKNTLVGKKVEYYLSEYLCCFYNLLAQVQLKVNYLSRKKITPYPNKVLLILKLIKSTFVHKNHFYTYSRFLWLAYPFFLAALRVCDLGCGDLFRCCWFFFFLARGASIKPKPNCAHLSSTL